MQLATAVPGLLLAPVIARMKDQRLLACATGLVTLVSMAGPGAMARRGSGLDRIVGCRPRRGDDFGAGVY